MLLSIIVPSFRQSSLLRGALESITDQSFTDYEVLIMDGNSQDDTADVVASFAGRIPVYLYIESDKGIYDAMNKGINRSRGDFLYFMGCDDRLADSEVLANVFADEYSVQYNHVLYGDAIYTGNGARHDGEFTLFKLIRNNICHQTLFTRREVFERLGNFDILYKTYADWEFNMRWFGQAWVKRQYLPIVIAYFNTTGFSSQFQDVEFRNAEPMLRRKYFPALVCYLAFHLERPLHYRTMKLLTFERLMVMKTISDMWIRLIGRIM